ELVVKNIQRQCEIEFPGAGKNVGNAVPPQACEMRVGHLLSQHRDNRVAADIRASPGDLSVSIESDAIGSGCAPTEPRLPSINLIRAIRIGLGLCIFAPGHATDEPGAVAELLMDALEQSRHAVLTRTPPAVPNASVDAGIHVADHIRLHPCLLL